MKIYCERGFTLIEIILVVLLIGLFAGLAVPVVMDTLDRVQRNSSLREVSSILRTARIRAVAFKAPISFNGDFESNEFWLTNIRTDEDYKIYELEDEIIFSEYDDGDSILNEGVFSILFFPQGNSSGGEITFTPPESEDSEDEERFFINVDPITGKPSIEFEEE